MCLLEKRIPFVMYVIWTNTKLSMVEIFINICNFDVKKKVNSKQQNLDKRILWGM